MDCFYVFEVMPAGPPLRYPQQFSSRQHAQEFIDQKKMLSSFADTQFEIRPDNPEEDAKQQRLFDGA